MFFFFFFSSRRRHTRWPRDWSSDVCSSDLSSKRRDASSTSLTRSAAGLSWSWSSSHFTACLIGASPAAIRGPPFATLRAGVVPFELCLPLLVEVLDSRDVFDGGPCRARRPAHRVHERLADLVVRGAGLLRSREASRHSGRAAGGRHRGERHQLHRLRIERAFPVVESGELLHRFHRLLLRSGMESSRRL